MRCKDEAFVFHHSSKIIKKGNYYIATHLPFLLFATQNTHTLLNKTHSHTQRVKEEEDGTENVGFFYSKCSETLHFCF